METVKRIQMVKVKSSNSDAMVWLVYIPQTRKAKYYCKSAISALRAAFLLKSQTSLPISKFSLAAVKAEIPPKQ